MDIFSILIFIMTMLCIFYLKASRDFIMCLKKSPKLYSCTLSRALMLIFDAFILLVCHSYCAAVISSNILKMCLKYIVKSKCEIGFTKYPAIRFADLIHTFYSRIGFLLLYLNKFQLNKQESKTKDQLFIGITHLPYFFPHCIIFYKHKLKLFISQSYVNITFECHCVLF